ncbi:hypothetical protein D3C76_1317040 [compost metagenome]
MLVNIFLTLFLGLFAVMNFFHTAKLARSHNWPLSKKKFFYGVDSVYALVITGALVAINCN